MQWGIDQIKGLVFIQVVIVVLIIGLELLRWIGVERLIQKMMHPFWFWSASAAVHPPS